MTTAKNIVRDPEGLANIKSAITFMEARINSFYQPLIEALTGKKIKVKPHPSSNMTDGKTVWLAVPLGLGRDTDHIKHLCGLRDQNLWMMCPRCAAEDEVDSNVFHEAAGHICFESFVEVNKDVKKRTFDTFLKAKVEAADASRLDEVWENMKQARTAMEVAGTVDCWLPLMTNVIEDIFVNQSMYAERPGTWKSMYATDYRYLMTGTTHLNGEIISWSGASPDQRAIMALYVMANKFDFALALLGDDIKPVIEDVRVQEAVKMENVIGHDTTSARLELSIEVLGYLREHGFGIDHRSFVFKPPPIVIEMTQAEYDALEESDEKPDPDDPEYVIKITDADPPEPKESSDEEEEGESGEGESGESDSSDEEGDDESGEGEPSESGDSEPSDEEGDEESDSSGSDSEPSDESKPSEDDSEGEFGDESEPSDEEDDDSEGEFGDSKSEPSEEEGEEEDEEEGESESSDESPGSDEDGEGKPSSSGKDADNAEPKDIKSRVQEELDRLAEQDKADAEQAMEVVNDFMGHPEKENTDPEPDEEALKEATKLVLNQRDFDQISFKISGIRKTQRDANEVSGVSLAQAPTISDIQPSLITLRAAFTENKRVGMETGLKVGPRLSPKHLYTAMTDDPRIHARKHLPVKQDWSVLIGLDVSGSTRGTTCDAIKKGGYAMAELLSMLGIPFALYAHTGSQHELVIISVKEFGEPWNDLTKKRCVGLNSYLANLDGHTLEFYRKTIARERSTDKLLMYFTDGAMPLENYTEELRILKANIAMCAAQKIRLVGVGVGNDDPLKYGLDMIRYDTLRDLPKLVSGLAERLK